MRKRLLPVSLKTMKITRGSFYKAFKDKHAVYLATLDRYDRQVVSSTVAFLGNPANGSGRDRILSLLTKIADMAETDGDRLGCFLCNAMADKAAQGGEIEQRLQAMALRLEAAFQKALEDDLTPQIARATAPEKLRGACWRCTSECVFWDALVLPAGWRGIASRKPKT
jgi:TetR/AcrR family transcriptional repressor of nem operon